MNGRPAERPAFAHRDSAALTAPAQPHATARRAATLAADAVMASANVWRGVTFTSRPVLQPDVVLSAPVPGHAGTTLGAGAWGSVELARYAGPRDVSMLGADAATAGRMARLTVTQLWTEVTQTLAPLAAAADPAASLAVTGGVLVNLYPRAGGLAAGYNSAELYARVAAPDLPLAPKLSANVDVHAVRGAYLEAGVSRALVTRPRAGLALGAAAGWNAGMSTTGRSGAPTPGFFAADGLTHVDLSLAGSTTLGAVTLAPAAHLVLGRDAAARQVAPAGAPHATRAAKLWVGTTLTWAVAPWTVAP